VVFKADANAGLCCCAVALPLGESIRCRRLDITSCSLRGDLGDFTDRGESPPSEGDFTERKRSEGIPTGDLNCSVIVSAACGLSCKTDAGKGLFAFSGERITGSERCFFEGDAFDSLCSTVPGSFILPGSYESDL
jgi:hypothetical protein